MSEHDKSPNPGWPGYVKAMLENRGMSNPNTMGSASVTPAPSKWVEVKQRLGIEVIAPADDALDLTLEELSDAILAALNERDAVNDRLRLSWREDTEKLEAVNQAFRDHVAQCPQCLEHLAKVSV